MSYYEFILILVLVTGYIVAIKNNRPASKRERLFLSFC